ncbi:MAG: hypothetical protein HND47_22605 [Chloroflexi bacterium]|nr:hypothetical protein [Chloroflexota bacterium]
MKIRPQDYPVIIIVVYVIFLLLGFLLGFLPGRGEGGHGRGMLNQPVPMWEAPA